MTKEQIKDEGLTLEVKMGGRIIFQTFPPNKYAMHDDTKELAKAMIAYSLEQITEAIELFNRTI